MIRLIRHPSVTWSEEIFRKAEKEGEWTDIQTYTPIDEQGWKMVKYLSKYLEEDSFELFTSPIKRAKNMARRIGTISSKNVGSCFSEIFTTDTVKGAYEIINKAKRNGVHPVRFWVEKYAIQEYGDKFWWVVELLRQQAMFSLAILRILENSPSNKIVCSHCLTISLILWSIKSQGKIFMGREDIPSLLEIAGSIPYTGISTIDFQEGQWKVLSIGETPHLKGHEKLIKGTLD